jgi:transposase-like protein
MKPKNKYINRSRISEAKFREFLRLFCLDIEATKIATLTGLNKNTIHRYSQLLRERIAKECEKESPMSGEIEVDESYFGPKRVRGKRGRGAGKKTPVFGLLKRNGKVYTQIIQEADRYTLHGIIKGKVDTDSVIYSDAWKAYDGLVDVGYRKHHRVHHGKNEFARGKSHINGIENFWGIAKVRLSKFRGMHSSTFYLHLKECEWRFNNRKENMYAILLKILQNKPLN